MYKYVLNFVVNISMMFAKYFEYYTIILGGSFFVDTLYKSYECQWKVSHPVNAYCLRRLDSGVVLSVGLEQCAWHQTSPSAVSAAL